eukprot:TRINITY_DN18322_c0_g1_i1.p1 TRINITY_DN18322_c0_g1~~TRINITY_DN18322_c0_g1_i1.p1  ORF type:complete len:346 (+),score=63.03 TRINITY_DN18322_c0_g1_i1:101-1138(+)
MPGARGLRTGLAVACLLVARADDSCWTPGFNEAICCRGPQGNPQCWGGPYTYERCCPAKPLPPVEKDPNKGPEEFPNCVENGVVLRNAAAHAVFVDASFYGAAGCYMNNCRFTDKFIAEDPGICARACADIDECTHWTFGFQDKAKKCFLRKSDGGRENLAGWSAGGKACAPRAFPPPFIALKVHDSPGLAACDKGKGPECPDLLAAAKTWIYATQNLKLATVNRVDAATFSHVDNIDRDSRAFIERATGEFRPSEEDYPRVLYNNRLIFRELRQWIEHMARAQHHDAQLSASDMSLPNPLRTGQLCVRSGSCYEPPPPPPPAPPPAPPPPAVAAAEPPAETATV